VTRTQDQNSSTVQHDPSEARKNLPVRSDSDSELVAGSDTDPELAPEVMQGIIVDQHTGRIVVQKTTHIGPLPPPTILGEYKNLDEELFDLIKAGFRDEPEHRREMERRESDRADRGQKYGKDVAFLGLLLGAGVSVIALLLRHPVMAAILAGVFVGVPLLLMVYVLVKGNRAEKEVAMAIARGLGKEKNLLPTPREEERDDTQGTKERAED